MPISINGSGTITGLSAGGLPDASITADDLAAGAARSNFGAGAVLQVVRTTITTYASYTLNNAAIQATALTASITPTSASSHIIVQMMASIQASSTGQGLFGEIRRGTSTTLNPTAGGGSYNYPIHWMNTFSLPNMGSQLATQTWLGFDSPSTTSATSYTFYVYGVSGTGSLNLNSQGVGRGSSVILLWEIAA